MSWRTSKMFREQWYESQQGQALWCSWACTFHSQVGSNKALKEWNFPDYHPKGSAAHNRQDGDWKYSAPVTWHLKLEAICDIVEHLRHFKHPPDLCSILGQGLFCPRKNMCDGMSQIWPLHDSTVQQHVADNLYSHSLAYLWRVTEMDNTVGI